MKSTTVTELRANLYKMVDIVLESGEPLLIKRKGEMLLLKKLDKKDPRK